MPFFMDSNNDITCQPMDFIDGPRNLCCDHILHLATAG
jgi:hypothetical protein